MSVRRPPLGAKSTSARVIAAVGAVSCLVALSSRASADDAQEFDVAKNRFEVSEYAEAVRLFTALLEPETAACAKGPTDGKCQCRLTDPDLVERARALDAASLVALGKGPEADVQFEKILRSNPSYAPNPAVLPPVVIDRFGQVRTRLKPELEKIFGANAEKVRQDKLAAQRARDAERKWIEELERLASEERIVEKSSRAVALLPFGVGQFQNGDRGYGAAFLASEVLAAGASIVSGVIEMRYGASASVPGVDKVKLGTDITAAQTVNIASFATAATLAVVGIVHAQITFVPERLVKRQRPLPPRPKAAVAPTVSIVPGGAGLGLSGSF